MATPLELAIQEIQELVGAVSGIRKAPDYPPKQMNAYPFAVAYPRTGLHKSDVLGMMTSLHDIVVEVHVSRKNLPTDAEKVMPFGHTIPLKLMEGQKDGFTNFQTFRDVLYEFVSLEWGGIDTLGYRFTITQVKIQTTVP